MKIFSKLLSPAPAGACAHAPDHVAEPQASACQGCGSTFNLRMCTTCGYVGCCESQQGHNAQHARQSEHGVIKSYPMGQGHFTWYYTCNRYL